MHSEIIKYLGLWKQSANRYTMKTWHHQIKFYGKSNRLGSLLWNSCGSCKECSEVCRDCRPPRSLDPSSSGPLASHGSSSGPLVHALELSNATRGMLKTLLNSTALSPRFVRLHDFGASNETRMV